MLAALNAITKELVTITNLTYVNAETVCELLHRLAATHLNIPITVVLDNARYQRCKLVQELAQQFHKVPGEAGIELLFLPSYSPNLNLKVPGDSGYRTLLEVCQKTVLVFEVLSRCRLVSIAILDCVAEAPTKHKVELESLLTLKFQTFKNVPILGHPPQDNEKTEEQVLALAA